MRIISLKVLREFWDRHPEAEGPLRQWFKTASYASWRSIKDVREVFPQADGVRTKNAETLTVFNICGNKYRLIVRIRYDFQLINVRHVLSHRHYDEGRWKE
jgi:mRNA interferase HigB